MTSAKELLQFYKIYSYVLPENNSNCYKFTKILESNYNLTNLIAKKPKNLRKFVEIFELLSTIIR